MDDRENPTTAVYRNIAPQEYDAAPAEQFRPFPRLPVELRLKIWSLIMIPRRVFWTMDASPSLRASPSPRPLYLANKESHEIFLHNYQLWRHTNSLRITYINLSIDTLCLPSGILDLKHLLDVPITSLGQLRWLDIAPSAALGRELDVSRLRAIASLEVVTVRALGHRDKAMKSADSERDISRLIPCSMPYTMAQNHYDFDVVYTLEVLAHAFGMSEDNHNYKGPTIAAFFTAEECMVNSARPDLLARSRCVWGTPSESTWNRLELAASETTIWPGREVAERDNWCIWEVHGLRDSIL